MGRDPSRNRDPEWVVTPTEIDSGVKRIGLLKSNSLSNVGRSTRDDDSFNGNLFFCLIVLFVCFFVRCVLEGGHGGRHGASSHLSDIWPGLVLPEWNITDDDDDSRINSGQVFDTNSVSVVRD